MGQVVSFAGLCKLTILRMNMILPKPSEAGSAMLRYSMSQEGSLSTIGSVKSFMPSVSTLTPGKTHGSGGGGCVQGDGVTALQAGPSPTPLVAVTLYWTDWPELIVSVYSLVPTGTVVIWVKAPPLMLL
ncbi:MAG: hypothetical protein DMG53_07395 [Acidobacteria bacterium]|nr:MAG: hypothetical protein DMG53_07395 [Acidobacteriota bacterium]